MTASNGFWKAAALVLMSALVTGAAAYISEGRANAQIAERVTATEEKVRGHDQRFEDLNDWLTRVESKLDRAIEQRGGR